MDVAKKTGHVLRSCRVARGWSEEEMAQRLGIDVEALQDRESGEALLPVEEVTSWLEALELSWAIFGAASDWMEELVEVADDEEVALKVLEFLAKTRRTRHWSRLAWL